MQSAKCKIKKTGEEEHNQLVLHFAFSILQFAVRFAVFPKEERPAGHPLSLSNAKLKIK